MARWLFLDDEWELIEEKQEPKQGDMIEMVLRDGHWHLVTFVCFYEWAVVYVNWDGIYARKSEWRFPPKKLDVTLQEIAEWKWVDKNLINIINE